jgi:hypothetical protein
MINRFPKEPYGFYAGGTLGVQSTPAINVVGTNWIQMRPFNAALFMFNFPTLATCAGLSFYLQESHDGSTPLFSSELQNISAVGDPPVYTAVPKQFGVDLAPFRLLGFTNGSTVMVLINHIVQPFIRLYRFVAMGATTDVLTISAELKQLQA